MFIDIYYDNILYKNYIITGNFGNIKSFDYNNNILYQKYIDIKHKDINSYHSIIVKKIKEMVKLFASCEDGNIKIWNFHSGFLLNKIKINNEGLTGISLWNDNYLFVGGDDKLIQLIDINNGIVLKKLSGHENIVLTIKKIIHPKFGECLISQNLNESKIKFWTIKNY